MNPAMEHTRFIWMLGEGIVMFRADAVLEPVLYIEIKVIFKYY
jgi:hypothetical protein